jgi:hypothetical protein
MKKIYSYAFAASVLMLASCSNETEPIVNGGEAGEIEGGYMAFNICAPSSSTRAMEDIEGGTFEPGTDLENQAETGTFLFFTKDGVMSQEPQTVMLEWQENSAQETPAVEKISRAVVVVGGKGEDLKPASVLVILNDKSNISWRGMTQDEVLKKVTEVAIATEIKDATTGIVTSSKDFIMSNASYFDEENEIVTATALAEDKIYETRKAAENGEPVDIYVERLAAKININTNGNDFTISSTGDFQVKGAEGGKMNLTPVITGIQIADQATSEYMFKNIDTAWINQWGGVKDALNKRSNWAITPVPQYFGVDEDGNPVEGYLNRSYNDYVKEITGNGLSKEGYNFYVRENTPLADVETTLTANRKSSVLLTAKLCYDGDINNPVDALVRWAGMYYVPSEFLKQAANFVKEYYYVKEEKEGKVILGNLTEDDLEYYDEEGHAALVADGKIKQYYMAAKVKDESKEYYTLKEGVDISVPVTLKDATNEASFEDINGALLEDTNVCYYWNGGKTYYFLEIKHDGKSGEISNEESEETTAYNFTTGVVRNNVYKITLTSLSGLGVPVYNPDEVIIPQNPDEDLYYIAARINILKWRIVSQNANFSNVEL